MRLIGPDERAVEIVDEAGQVLKGACHLMVGGDAPLAPPGVYRLLGEVRYLAGLLGEVVQHTTRDASTASDRRVLYASDGGDPEDALQNAVAHLTDAGRAVQDLHAQLDAAQTAIATVGYRDAPSLGTR